MQQLVERRQEQHNKTKQERESAKNKKIDIKNLGDYNTVKHEREKGMFEDDDELLQMQIMINKSYREEARAVNKAFVKTH